MSTKLIQTKDYLLLIDEEAEIKVGDCVLSPINNVVIESFPDIGIYKAKEDGNVKIIAYYPITKNAQELDLPMLPNPFKEEIDIEDLAFQSSVNYYGGGNMYYKKGFIKGYKTAQAKQFSLEDMKKAIVFGVENAPTIETHTKMISNKDYRYFVLEELINKYIQSLSTQQLPKEFVGWLSKKKCPYYFTSRCTIDRCDCKFVFETVTNSEGKEELVGTYKY